MYDAITDILRSHLLVKSSSFLLVFVTLVASFSLCFASVSTTQKPVNNTPACETLQLGQYYCSEPVINDETQQADNCDPDSQTVLVKCFPVQGIFCNGKNHTGSSEGFRKSVPCKLTNGHSFSVALLLSVFLGFLGADRFYLGYPALGLLKLCTLGFMFLGQLVDILLIALQIVGPADGSEYVIDYYGPGISRIDRDNYTYLKPQY